MKKKTAAKIVFGNKERKQFPDPEGLEREKPSSAIEGPTQPLGFGYRLRSKFSEQVSEIGLEKQRNEKMLNRGMRQTFASRSNKRPKHLQHPAPVRGGQYRSTPQMERPHYEETEKMSTKSFREFMTEAAKRGRPRKLRPGEEADTLHIQDQLSKLTHPNHVDVHFKDGSKHRIPREHANMALHHLNSLKPIDRADHAAHMSKGHTEFYHVLSKKSIPAKKGKITLAGPKLRKEEVEQIDELKKSALQAVRNRAHGNLMDNPSDEKSHKVEKQASSRLKKITDKENDERSKREYAAWKEEVEQVDEDIKREYAELKKHNIKTLRDMIKTGNKVHDTSEYRTKDDAVTKILHDKHGSKKVEAAFNEEVEQIDEKMDQAKKDEYVKRASSQASLANFTKRHATGQAKTDAENIERKRRKGLNMALKREEIEYTAEELELYNSLSDEHKVIFEKMSRAELDKMVADYHAKGGKTKTAEYKPPKDSEKTWPASKMKGSKWASTAGSISRKNQGYKK